MLGSTCIQIQDLNTSQDALTTKPLGSLVEEQKTSYMSTMHCLEAAD